MAAVMVILAIMMILSTIAVQDWADVVRRDNEAEMMFRAQEIVRAILRFQRDQGGQQLTELQQLMEPGSRGQYFLRRLYDDPLVKDGKWALLYAGPNGSIVDPNSVAAAEGVVLGENLPLEAVGGVQSGFSGGPREAAGLPIIGVRTLSTDKPFRVYRGMQDYAQWLFTIYDLVPQARGPGAGQPGQPGQAAQPGAQQPRRPNRPNQPRSGRSGSGR